jgi:hypothetical protein
VRKTVRLVMAALAATALMFASALPAGAATITLRVNKAIVVNTTTNSSAFKLGFSASATGDSLVVSAVNEALPVSSGCVNCQTVAIAFHIVLAKTAAVVRSVNRAVSLQILCVHCSNLAAAYQFVVVGGPPSLPKTMQPEFDSVRAELVALHSSSLSIDAMQARVDEIAGDLITALLNQLSATGARQATTQNSGGAPTLTVYKASDKK